MIWARVTRSNWTGSVIIVGLPTDGANRGLVILCLKPSMFHPCLIMLLQNFMTCSRLILNDWMFYLMNWDAPGLLQSGEIRICAEMKGRMVILSYGICFNHTRRPRWFRDIELGGFDPGHFTWRLMKLRVVFNTTLRV